MFRFLRKIRQRLLSENRVSQYLLYALGEIVLVMIGILLALQVNTWNEKRKDQAFLNFSLQEIHADLKSDLGLIYQGIEPRLRMRVQGSERLYNMMLEERRPEDSVFLDAYRQMKMSFLLTATTESYQSLKERGLEIIPDKELRNYLFNFYEIGLPRSHTFITAQDERIRDRTTELEETVFQLEVRKSDQGEPVHVQVPISEDYIHHQALHRILLLNTADTRQKRYRLRNLKKQYFATLDMLEDELNKRSLAFTPFDSTNIQPDF